MGASGLVGGAAAAAATAAAAKRQWQRVAGCRRAVVVNDDDKTTSREEWAGRSCGRETGREESDGRPLAEGWRGVRALRAERGACLICRWSLSMKGLQAHAQPLRTLSTPTRTLSSPAPTRLATKARAPRPAPRPPQPTRGHALAALSAAFTAHYPRPGGPQTLLRASILLHTRPQPTAVPERRVPIANQLQ